jgi:hypothetical protein
VNRFDFLLMALDQKGTKTECNDADCDGSKAASGDRERLQRGRTEGDEAAALMQLTGQAQS